MANWQMEVGRMTLYILFPIGIYYYFNQGDNIEGWIKKEKKKFDCISDKQRDDIKQIIENFNNKQQMEKLTEMEAQYQRMNIE